jgi:hypothetical protein
MLGPGASGMHALHVKMSVKPCDDANQHAMGVCHVCEMNRNGMLQRG